MKYGLTQLVITKIQNVFKEHSEISQVILYGSRALSTNRDNSDIDLTIKTNRDVSVEFLLSLKSELDDLMIPYMIDISLFKNIDNQALLDHINRVGIIFFESSKVAQA